MNLTIELLRTVGSPYASSNLLSAVSVHPRLLHYSFKNRLPLLYLEAIGQMKESRIFREIHNQQIARYTETFEALTRISQTLQKANINYAIFKTLRPYISTTVDIDIIIFGTTLDYERAIKAVKRKEYLMLARGPQSTTFEDPRIKIGVDLYDEVAVSHIIYLDKDRLECHVTTRDLPNGLQIKTLTCEADLIAIIAHSIIKENMYTISEYYTYMYYLEKMDADCFIKLAKNTHLNHSTRTHTALTAMLCQTAHGIIPEKLQKILSEVGMDSFEILRAAKSEYRMPHKYHPMTLAKSLLEIAKGKKTRESIATQLFGMLNPKFSKDFVNKLTSHISRETY